MVTIERLGGLGGFGGPGSRIRSRGSVSPDALSPDDRARVDALFRGDGAATPAHADGFTYRLTRDGPAGKQSIEVPESAVPAALVASVRDEIG